MACQSPFCNLAVIVQVLVFFLNARRQFPCEFRPTPLAFKLNDACAPPTSKVTDLPPKLKPSGNSMIAVRLHESALGFAKFAFTCSLVICIWQATTTVRSLLVEAWPSLTVTLAL